MKSIIRLIYSLLFFCFLCGILSAQTEYSISGQCKVQEPGILYIYLVDEKTFSKQQESLMSEILSIEKAAAGGEVVSFHFSVVPGKYGIRCFLDTNGNGILDGGMFGPAEPWGMSWQEKRIIRWPKFKEIAFVLTQDITLPEISLE